MIVDNYRPLGLTRRNGFLGTYVSIRLVFMWSLFFIIPSLTAQHDVKDFNHISTSDKFTLNSVTAITQDRNGFMWFGTRNGLLRYDGIDLKFIKRKLPKKPGKNVNDINAVHIDQKGNIWMATSFGLSVYYPETDSIENFPTLDPTGAWPSSNIITSVLETSSGEIWFGSYNGLNIYDPVKKMFTRVFADEKVLTSISSNYINALYQSKDGTIWVGTDSGLNRFTGSKNDKFIFEIFQHDPSKPSSVIDNYINVMLEDKLGNLWVGTQSGLDYFEKSSKKFIHFSKQQENVLTSEVIRALTIDKSNRLWVGTYDGINIIDEQEVVQHVKHDPKTKTSLLDNKIRALFTDRNGTVWIGTYYGGINYWDERQLNFTKIEEGNGSKLGARVVSSILEDEGGKIYFGTEGAGISIYDSKTDQYQYLNKLKNGLEIGTVKTLFLEGRDDIWIGTFNHGLIHLNLKTNVCRQFLEQPDDEESISSDRVLSIAEGSSENLWIGTLVGGLNLYDPNKGTFKQIKANPEDTHSLYSNSVRSLLVAENDDLYVGTSLGLCVLANSSEYLSAPVSFERISTATDSLPPLDIQDIYEDNEGGIWVATVEYGLFMFKNKALHPIDLDGVTSVFSILQDEENIFWLSSDEGVVRYDPVNHTVKVYDSREGVQPNEFLRASKLISKSNRVYFGGASGVTSFMPEAVGAINEYAPDVVLTEFSLFDEPLEVGDSTGILKRAIESTEKVTLDYDQNIFTIGFAMPNFINTGNNVYHYRLKGLDDKWTTTSKPTVTYTIQRGGDYQFEVRAENSDGFQTSNVTTLSIEVFNPPWRTWWAYLIYSVLFLTALSIIAFFFQSRMKLQHKLDLETREFLHQQEVNNQKLQFFTNISHEFRTPLTLISGPLQKLLDEYKGPHKLFRQLLVIKKNSDQLFKLINELMDFRKLENKQMKLGAAEGNIVVFLKEVFISFQQQAKSGKYSYTFETYSEEINIYFDRNKLEKVFYNLLSNAFKHTPRKGCIALKVNRQATHLEIMVQDNGDGMDTDQIEKIFDRFYEIPDQKNYGKFKHGSGIGLAIVKNVVELHKGTVRVESTEGLGSSFIVSLPLGRGHLMEDEIIGEFRDSEDITLYNKELTVDQQSEFSSGAAFVESEENNKRCILVVEDNQEVANFIKSVLDDFYRVVIVENGALGYQSAASLQPDLIISDLMMPEMDGIEFCSKVKSDIRTSHIPFILLSARTSLVYKYDGLESGADEYLYKPFEIKELLLKCKNIINTHDRLKEKFQNSSVATPAEVAQNSLDESMMDKAFQIVKENISNELFDVVQFSEQLGISRSLLFIKFKAWSDQTPNEFILSMRMKQAAHLIEQNKYNISEIGYKVGFKDPSYFSKIFKKHFSMSPKAYAEKFMEGFYVG